MSGAPEFLKAQARYVELQQQRTRDSGKVESTPSKLADHLRANGVLDHAALLDQIAAAIGTGRAGDLDAGVLRGIAAELRRLMGAAS